MADIAMAEAQQEDPLSLPPHGTEVFIGGLPRTITEQQLRDFASEAGDVHSAKLIKDPNNPSQNRGYGFIKFYTSEAAATAMDRLHFKELPDYPSTKVRIQPSQAKHKLFIGGIPHELTREDLRELLEPVVKGLEKVDMVKSKDPAHPEQNRGFAFLEFYNSSCAALAKSALSQPDFKIGNKTPTVDYAEPSQRDTQAAGGGGGGGGSGGAKNVFVGNLPPGANEEALRALFSKYGEVERTHIPRPRDGDTHSKFGFVHFRERAAAMHAVEDLEKPELDGTLLNVRYGRSDGSGQQQGGGSGMGRSSGSSGMGGGAGAVYDGMAAGGGTAGGGMQGMAGLGVQGLGMMMGNSLVSLVPVQLPNGQIGYMMAGTGGIPAAGGMAGMAEGGGAGGPMRGSAAGYGGGRGGSGQYSGATGRGGRGRGGAGGGGQRYQPY